MSRIEDLLEARRAQRFHWVQSGEGKIVFRGNERQCQSHYRRNGGLKGGLSLMSKSMVGGRPELTPEPSGAEAEAPAEELKMTRVLDIVEQFETGMVRAQMDEASGRKKLNLKAMWKKGMTDPAVIKKQQQDPNLAKMFVGDED